MNSISKKNYRQYSQVSRYATFPYYYHELDDAYFYGLTNQLEIDNTDLDLFCLFINLYFGSFC